MGQGIVYLGVLAILAALSGWFLFTVESSLQEDDQAATERPILYIDNFLATVMNVQGIRNYTLTSPHSVQMPGKQGTWLDRPDIDVFQENGKVRDWLIRAESGWISADHQLIRLQDAVSMTRPTSSGKRPVVINTRNVLVYPYEDYAETDEPSRLVTPGGIVDSIGFKAWLDEEQLELLATVRGKYEPSKP